MIKKNQTKTKQSRGLQPFRNPGYPLGAAFRIARDRRGILLLVVLSMLVLFLLIGTSFIVSSNQYRKANKTLGKPYTPAKSPLQHIDLLEEVVNQLVRDTNNKFSSLRYHSLLRDLYGGDGFFFELPSGRHGGTGTTIVNFAPNTGGQFIRVDIVFSTPPPLSQINGYYNGLVWTIADGSASGQSVRIVNYRYLPSIDTYRFELMRPEHFSGLAEDFAEGGDRVVLNGRPFNGTGVGYNRLAKTGSAQLNATVRVNGVDREIALLPNAVFFPFGSVSPDGYGSEWPGPGGSDESYDAPDFQNMALAWSPVNPIETLMPSLVPADATPQHPFHRDNLPLQLGKVVLPSFHRPALINYWANQVTLQTEPNLLRKVMLRPSWFDHPEFTGSNPDFAAATTDQDRLLRMIYGPWDVDNDNDGRRDSVWVDFGAPVMMSPQGKLVKPLAAILCLDMDGRLNLNAHGSMADIVKPFFNLDVAGNPTYTDNNNVTFTESDALPQGQGYGPAEISLEPVVSNLYQRILQGVRANSDFDLNAQGNPFDRAWSGRYGHMQTVPTPGFQNSYDLLAQFKQQGLPQWANNTGGLLGRLGNYATPPDLKGRYAVGLNDLGQPVYEAAFDTLQNLDQDSPYELDLSRVGPNAAGDRAKDGPFSLAEMERILRAYDHDAGKLPPRLWELANRFRTATSGSQVDIDELNEWRALLTTDSFDLPVPSVVLPEWMRLGPDGQPGVAGVDDDGNLTTDDATEIGAEDSDDFAAVKGTTDAGGNHIPRIPTNLSLSDLFEYRIRLALAKTKQYASPPLPQLPVLAKNIPRLHVNAVLKQLMAPELADGLRLDLNRPFGNGRDDNDNGVVDEPGELEFRDLNSNGILDPNEPSHWDTFDRIQTVPSAASAFKGPTGDFRDNVDRDGDGDIEPWERGDIDRNGRLSTMERINLHNFRRQLFARHLYVLAMTLVDPHRSEASPADREKRARRLAQWAINVVDFRDPDNIMTAFEYDANPFDGWLPDGDLADTRDIYGPDNKPGGSNDIGGLVWGCERPELVITETMAWHDRRTTDQTSPIESSNIIGDFTETAAFVTDPLKTPPDYDFDQLYRPRGALFVELYNPWPAETAANADTHLLSSTGKDLGINISAVAVDPSNPTNISPVWRIAVHQRPVRDADGEIVNSVDAAAWDPDSPEVSRQPLLKMDRCFYFAQIDDTGSAKDPDMAVKLSAIHNMDVNDGVEFFCGADSAYHDLQNMPGMAGVTGVAVRPGRYMVVGGGKEDLNRPGIYVTEIAKRTFGSKQRRIELDMNNSRVGQALPTATGNVSETPFRFVEPSAQTNGIPVQDLDGFALTSDPTDPVCNVMVINRAISSDGTQALKRNMTITEPARGYPGDDPTIEYKGLGYYNNPDGEGWYGNKFSKQAWDTPLDDARKDGETRLSLPENQSAQRIIECFSVLYLQRLANPLLPFHKDTNPYLTVDSMSANVTVFNGASEDEKLRPAPEEEGDWTVYGNDFARLYFSSLQRGYAARTIAKTPPQTIYESDIFSYEPPSGSLGDADGLINNWGMTRVPGNTRPRRGLGTSQYKHTFNAVPDFTLGAMNHAFEDPAQPRDGLTPGEPYSWLTWNNRPFVGGNELMMVPRSRSSQLLKEFVGAANPTNPYDPENVPRRIQNTNLNPKPEYVSQKRVGMFGHLSNYFLAEEAGASKLPDVPANFFRVLEYVHVPSRYVGTETWLNPAAFGNFNVTTTDDPRYLRQPPFNKVSAYRDPGRVNLNTIGDHRVWDGGLLHRELHDPTRPWLPLAGANGTVVDLANDIRINNYLPESGHLGPLSVVGDMADPMNPTFNPDFIAGRRGYIGDLFKASVFPNLEPTDSMLLLDANVPTFFANPFRSPDAGDLVPLLNMQRPGVECTTLRRQMYSAGLDGLWGDPFVDDDMNGIVDDLSEAGMGTLNDDVILDPPLFASNLAGAGNEYHDANRNAYFRYQPMTRLSELTTTRSNVYAVWITIGFFEVEEAPDRDVFANQNFGTSPTVASDALYDRVYPEGYQLGREMGSDTGEFERLREFAIVDRSIPVAFEPGEDHNVERAVRLRRRIE